MNELNESLSNDLMYRDLTYLIKKQIKLLNLKVGPRKLKLDIQKSLSENKECEVEFESIIDANRFYLHLANWNLIHNDMVENMKKDKFTNLTDNELTQGHLCVCIDQLKNTYRRAVIVKILSKKLLLGLRSI